MVVHYRTFKQVDRLTKGKLLSDKSESLVAIDLSERRATDENTGSRVSLNADSFFGENRENRRFTKKTEDYLLR